MPYPSSVDSGSGSFTIAQGGSLYIVDNNGVLNKVFFINNNEYAQFEAPASNVFEFTDNSGNALFFANGATAAFQLPPGVTFNADDSGFVAGPVLFVTSGGATVLQAHPTLNIIELVDSSGNVIFSTKQSATAAAIANGNTITTTGIGEARVAPTGNVTGIIMQAGTTPSQECVVVNESAFTVTFAAVGTSNMADGTLAVIAANRKMDCTWDSSASKWYHS